MASSEGISGHYRPDIDGLRAVAVWLVLIFHIGLLPLSGGYVGVDVFFVISGFVIARMIVSGLDDPRGFSFATFYRRRFLRLVPAMLAVTVFCFAAGWFLLGSQDYLGLARSAIAANTFWSNWHFARLDGYFMAEPSSMPLLHTWSLSVEEQFYLFAPLLIVGHVKRPGWPVLVALGCVVSLGLAVFSGFRASNGAYYHTANRVFELGVGVALATIPSLSRRIAHAVPGLGWIGLALIGGSAVLLDKTQWFPGPFALPVVLGTACLIIAGEQPSIITRVLASTPLVANGRLSYSLYLWHWPLLSAALAYAGRELVLVEKLALTAAVVAVAGASYAVIEQPARKATGRGSNVAFSLTFVGLIAVLAFAISVDSKKGIPSRFPDAERFAERDADDKGIGFGRCLDGERFRCTLGVDDGSDPRVLFWGDSHVAMLAGELHDILAASGFNGRLIGSGACAPLVGPDGESAFGPGRCADDVRDVRALLQSAPSIRHVVLGGFWQQYAGAGSRHPLTRSGAFGPSLLRVVDMLTAEGRTVTLLGPVPSASPHVARHRLRNLHSSIGPVVWSTMDEFMQWASPILALLTPLNGTKSVVVILPHLTLCRNGRGCELRRERERFYWDGNHLSIHGARLFRDELAAEIARGLGR